MIQQHNLPAQRDNDKACHRNFPTFIAANKALKQPQQGKRNINRSTQKCTTPAHEIFTVDYTCKE